MASKSLLQCLKESPWYPVIKGQLALAGSLAGATSFFLYFHLEDAGKKTRRLLGIIGFLYFIVAALSQGSVVSYHDREGNLRYLQNYQNNVNNQIRQQAISAGYVQQANWNATLHTNRMHYADMRRY